MGVLTLLVLNRALDLSRLKAVLDTMHHCTMQIRLRLGGRGAGRPLQHGLLLRPPGRAARSADLR